MDKIIVKKAGQKYFVKKIGNDGSSSDRIILPTGDKCRVKVTFFTAMARLQLKGIEYDCDETALILSGSFKIKLTESKEEFRLSAGGTFHVPAGTSYELSTTTGGEIFCVFSPAITIPDDE